MPLVIDNLVYQLVSFVFVVLWATGADQTKDKSTTQPPVQQHNRLNFNINPSPAKSALE
jgi:hypothetical protein